MRFQVLLITGLLILAPFAALAQTTITIDRCYDGDTCTSNEGEKIRLACIDTPELRGKRANPIPAKAAKADKSSLEERTGQACESIDVMAWVLF